jgi:hypothetical protein
MAPFLLAGGLSLSAQAQGPDTAQLQAEINALKAQMKALESKMQKAQQAAAQQPVYAPPPPYEPPQPWDKKFHLFGVTITPGGFLAAEGLWRNHAQITDITDVGFGSIPALNSSTAHTNELRFTARQSRVSALAEGQIDAQTIVSAYGELDFLGAANTANSNESNSYQPRIRQLYGTVDWNDWGFHILAGQSWSLLTLQGKGITPRNEVIPATIDAQYVVGFTWARQPGIRLTYNYGPDFWLAVSAEQSQTTGCPALTAGAAFPPAPGTVIVPTGLTGISTTCNVQAQSGGLLDQVTTYSLDHIPDGIAKAAWEPTILDRRIHLEAMGVVTDLYNQVDIPITATTFNGINRDTAGWGVGGGVIVPLWPKLIDLQGSVLAGRGIGRYGSGQLIDATFNADGSLRAIPEIMFLGGATFHATPWLDFYAYGGMERQNATFIATSATTQVGIGFPGAINNTGCFIIGGTCTAQTHDVWEVTGGFWDTVYSGAFGQVRAGMQYSFVQRDFFPGTVGLPRGSAPLGADTNVNTIMASLRYYPFANDAPPPPPPVVAKY